MRDTYKNQE